MKLQRHLATESETPEGAENDSPAYIEALAKQQPYLEPWCGFDLDKTLAIHEEWKGCLHIGAPIPAMIERIQAKAKEMRVKIFTARVSYADDRINAAVRQAIEAWCQEHIGQVFEVTNIKDMAMRELYDDRAFQVLPNQGIVVDAPKHAPGTSAQFTKELKAELGQD
jgi:hypothetical protein